MFRPSPNMVVILAKFVLALHKNFHPLKVKIVDQRGPALLKSLQLLALPLARFPVRSAYLASCRPSSTKCILMTLRYILIWLLSNFKERHNQKTTIRKSSLVCTQAFDDCHNKFQSSALRIWSMPFVVRIFPMFKKI